LSRKTPVEFFHVFNGTPQTEGSSIWGVDRVKPEACKILEQVQADRSLPIHAGDFLEPTTVGESTHGCRHEIDPTGETASQRFRSRVGGSIEHVHQDLSSWGERSGSSFQF